ncbi:MAG TPA: GAF and ANTAR domain-containing protein [Solirubrobacteraceae bacterium]|jgi:GAF domain-containing protein|nr:GAF and ANTAR domain-containing protein [Solirubrobacteraceae bacterium]
MTREERIVATFVELADAIVDDFDVVEFLHHLAERCVELLDCSEAGLLLADAAGALRVMASSSERADALDLLRAQAEEGPGFECHRRGTPVLSEDLLADHARWPAFTSVAVERGFRSVHAVPMRVRGEAAGALNLFRVVTGRIDERDLPLAQGMADLAAIALLQERAACESRHVVQQLQDALNSRVIIEQAKGILSERAHIGVDDAFARLRAYARRHNRRLGDIARDLVAGRLDASSVDASTSSTGRPRN